MITFKLTYMVLDASGSFVVIPDDGQLGWNMLDWH